MAKNKVSEWSSNPANNTDVGGIDIAEGCAPSGINNAIREMMAQIKDMESGADGDNMTVGGNLSVDGTVSFGSTLDVVGNTALSGDLDVAGDIIGGLVGNVNGNVTGNLISVTNTVNAGDFISGHTYTIATVGTTDFTAIGAASNTVGVIFTATGVGSGTGTATTVTGNAVNVTGTIAVANGGTGATSLTANSVLLGNGTSALQAVAPSTAGNVLVSDGTTWTSAAQTPAKLSTASGSAPSYSARAYANIAGNSVIDLNGQTYSQAGTTVSVTTGSAHPFKAGDAVYLNFTSGTATDGLYTIATAVDNTHFTVTRGTSTSTGGLVNIPLRTINNGKNVSSVTASTTSSSASYFYVNFTTALPDSNSAVMAMVNTGTVVIPSISTTHVDVDTSANNPSIISVVVFD